MIPGTIPISVKSLYHPTGDCSPSKPTGRSRAKKIVKQHKTLKRIIGTKLNFTILFKDTKTYQFSNIMLFIIQYE